MSNFRNLSDTMMASPQIAADDIAQAKAQGVTRIVNNRPDGESPDQIPGAVIAAAAHDAGIDYIAIPVTSAGFSQPQVDAMAEALGLAGGADGTGGKVLAYCRSGTRSAFLWALAQAKNGMAPDAIAHAAQAAGYDISPVRPTVDMLAAGSGGDAG